MKKNLPPRSGKKRWNRVKLKQSESKQDTSIKDEEMDVSEAEAVHGIGLTTSQVDSELLPLHRRPKMSNDIYLAHVVAHAKLDLAREANVTKIRVGSMF